MTSDSAGKIAIATPPPASGAQPTTGGSSRPANGFAMRFGQIDIPVLKPELIIGRTATADIVVDSPLVSRRHALLSLHDDGSLYVEDLGSRNGTVVNGSFIESPRALALGDKVLIGEHELVVAEDHTSPRSRRITATAARTQELTAVGRRNLFAAEERTHHSSAFSLLGGLVDKAFALGHGAEAERLLAGHLARLLVDAQTGKLPQPDTAAAAAGYALKLAAALGRPGWVDYAVKLYAAIGAPLPMPLVDELFSLLRRVRGLDVAALRSYLDSLRTASAKLGPADRFALQRLEGLLKIVR